MILNFLKKGKRGWFFVVFYGRFLSVSIINAPIITITIMIAAMPGSKYMSANDGVSRGSVVA